MFDITNNFMVKKIQDIRFLYLVKMDRVGVVSFLKFCLKNLNIPPRWDKESYMDTDKWKSIAVPIETWKKLNKMAKQNFRTVGATITYLTEKEYESKKLVDEKV